MEELDLVFEFPVLVDAHSWVWWLRCNELEEGVNADSLNKLSVTFERLELLIFTLLDTPENWSAVEGTWDKELRIIGPSDVNYIANMSSELTWVTPLHSLIKLSKFDRCHLELPNDNHLVITTTSKVLAVGGEPHDIDCWGMTTLQVVLMLRLVSLCTWLLLNVSGCLNGCKMVTIFRHELPVADPRVKLVDLGACDEASWVWEKVQGHDSGWLFVPAYLRDFYLHILHFLFYGMILE